MNVLRKSITLIGLACLLIGHSTINAFSSDEVLRSEQGEILSEVSVFAGSGELNDRDGTVHQSAFRIPQSIVVLDDGTVFVADTSNHLIRQIKDGQVTTFAGITYDTDAAGFPAGGWYDDESRHSMFNYPIGLAVDTQGNLYIADAKNHVIRKITTDGKATTVAGDGTIGKQDGRGKEARFYHPSDLVVAEDGTIYVTDTLNHLIRKISVDGHVTTLNAPSDRIVEVEDGIIERTGNYQDGPLTEAMFNEPSGIAMDAKGNLYVSDSGNHLIRYIDLEAGTVTTIAGLPDDVESMYPERSLYAEGGYVDGPVQEALFYFPKGLALTKEGGLVIADSLNHVVRYLYDGQVITLAGDPSDQAGRANGINGHNQLHFPTDVALLPNGDILISDSYNQQIRILQFYRLPDDLPQNDQVKVVYGSQVVQFDTQPEIKNSRTMIPVRALMEIMGYTVEYIDEEQRVLMNKGNTELQLQIHQNEMTVTRDGVEEVIHMDVAPYIKNSRTYVPIRFFSEQFGLDVQWIDERRTVVIREKEGQQ